jgi:hypothetical protein
LAKPFLGAVAAAPVLLLLAAAPRAIGTTKVVAVEVVAD